MSKIILFLVSDSAEERNLHEGLTESQPGWQVIVVHTPDEAVAVVESKPVDVVVADFQLECRTGAAFLNRVGEHSPKTLRFILAQPADREHVLRTVLGQHHFLSKPVAPVAFAGTVEMALSLDSTLPNEKLRNLAARIRAFPPMPSLYFQALNELKSENCSAEILGEIVAKDLGMTARLLQVLNSGFYSLSRQITDPAEAVGLLGQEMVKSLLLSIHIFLKYDHIKPLYFSISQVWRHSTAVAHGARLITRMETGNAEWAEDAYTAGLMHDIGKLVLAQNFEAQYNDVQRAARAANRPLWELEKEAFGASHGELGAFLLGRWGMPVGLIEATALHHQPLRSGSREFSVLTAVHVANALEQERHDPERKLVSSTLDAGYLTELGLADRVETWREVIRAGKLPGDHEPLSRVPNAERGESSSSADSGHTGSQLVRNRVSRNETVLATVATVAAVVLTGWYLTNRWTDPKDLPVRASTIETPIGVDERAGAETNKVEDAAGAESNPSSLLPLSLDDLPSPAPKRE